MAVLLSADSVSSWTRKKPWLWLNVLSVDAPLVAVTWQIWFARCFHVALAIRSVAALALTVWIIYTADRLLDVWRSGANPLRSERHQFHRQHWRTLVMAVGLCLLALSSLATLLNPLLLRDGLVLSSVVALYFLIVHALPALLLDLCPKEMAVAILFALGTGLAPWTRLQHPQSLIIPVALFGCLCFLNCAAIEVWECRRFGDRHTTPPHFVTLWLARHLRLLAILIAVTGVVLLAFSRVPMVFAAIVLAALAFCWLDIERNRLSADWLRVLADLPLLSPLLLLLAGLR